jgi:hypothetical protein
MDLCNKLLVFPLGVAWLKSASRNSGNHALMLLLQLYHQIFLWYARGIFVKVQHCHLIFRTWHW